MNIMLAAKYFKSALRNVYMDCTPLPSLLHDERQEDDSSDDERIVRERFVLESNLELSFQNVVQLRLNVAGRDCYPSTEGHAAAFTGFLGSKKQLRSIDLAGDVFESLTRSQAQQNPWIKAICANSWPSLNTLILREVIIQNSRLTSFLGRHANTLKRLHIEDHCIPLDDDLDADFEDHYEGSVHCLLTYFRESRHSCEELCV